MTDIYEEFSELGRNSSQISKVCGKTKPVSLRLNVELVCQIDTLAEFTGHNRQGLLSKVIASGVDLAEEAFLGSAPDLQNEYQQSLFGRLQDAGITQ